MNLIASELFGGHSKKTNSIKIFFANCMNIALMAEAFLYFSSFISSFVFLRTSAAALIASSEFSLIFFSSFKSILFCRHLAKPSIPICVSYTYSNVAVPLGSLK